MKRWNLIEGLDGLAGWLLEDSFDVLLIKLFFTCLTVC